MTVYSTTRLMPALIIRHIRKGLRIRILQIFAIDKTMRARDEQSSFDAHRDHGMSHPRHFFR